MASQSLYRKWRSQTFDEMVGREEIIRTLKNALETNQLRHAYLFTGPRGTGKTTTARLLAKAVNCANPRDGEPCNECQQCREITAGISFNVIEIDAASNRGIDSIRELREKVMVPPSTGKYKVYILDEAHMLTTEAFNALLKTLEEPPDYAIFVMATTDVHKMLPTVLSRCQQFNFKRFPTRQIVQHLLFVAKEEEIELEKSAAELIARSAAGGMRDALSLLDQAIAYAGNEVSLAQVQAMLGVADPRAISKLITHIAGLDSPALLYQIHELSEAGADLRQVNAQLIEYWRALMLAKAGADVATILDLTEDEVSEVGQLIPAFPLEELTECARIFAQNEFMQKSQGTPQLGLELASLECIELHRRVQSGLPAIPQSAPTAIPSQAATQPTPAASLLARSEKRAETARSNPPEEFRQEINSPPQGNKRETPGEAMRSARNQALSASPASSAQARATLTLPQVRAAWESVKKRTRQKSPPLATYIGMCDVLGVEEEGEHTVIVLRAAKPAHHKFIKEGDRPKDVEWALSMEFNAACKLRVLAPDQPYTGAASESPAASSYTFGAIANQPSAYRERAQPAPPESVRAPEPSAPPAPTRSSGAGPFDAYEPPPLARPQGVRENKRVVLSKEELEQKVQQDPVVQEIVRTFQAKIKDIQAK